MKNTKCMLCTRKFFLCIRNPQQMITIIICEEIENPFKRISSFFDEFRKTRKNSKQKSKCRKKEEKTKQYPQFSELDTMALFPHKTSVVRPSDHSPKLLRPGAIRLLVMAMLSVCVCEGVCVCLAPEPINSSDENELFVFNELITNAYSQRTDLHTYIHT